MKSKHTPGPWVVSKRSGNANSFEIDAPPTTETLAEVYGKEVFPKNAKANALLIASAPELLDALEKILMVCAPEEEDYDPGQILYDAQAIARRAIAIATGVKVAI